MRKRFDMLSSSDIPQISLRHLKAHLYVTRSKNLTRAAESLSRSQTSITKAITSLEGTLGYSLFERSHTGMHPTQHGQCLAQWVELAEAEFRAAEEAYKKLPNSRRDSRNLAIFSMNISYKRLASLVVLHDHRDTVIAANKLGITRAAISGAVREMEELLDISLFERSPGGLISSPYCEILVRHIKLAFAQIRHGLDELASLSGITQGRIAVGTLPYTRTVLIPRAINRVINAHPQLKVATSEGSYAQLEVALRSGDLDIIVGAIRSDSESKGLSTERLFDDRLALIVRSGHPLTTQKSTLSINTLRDAQWILPARNTPARQLFDLVLQEYQLPEPEKTVETSSLSTVRGLLLESDSVALLSEHQISFDQQFGILTALPVELNQTYRPIGVTMRAQARLSPAADVFLEELRAVARQLPQSRLN